MSEDTSLMSKPKKIWNDALRMVKGEDSTQLMESFTAEMTLVAEGLCEDQNRLRGEVSRMMNEEDRRLQKNESHLQELEQTLEEQQREHDRTLTELRNRIAALEKQLSRESRERQSELARKGKKERNRIRDLTILICVAAVAAIAVLLVWKLV
jgi:predicted RNase H-like nuclease (RuvC/YqgF family)